MAEPAKKQSKPVAGDLDALLTGLGIDASSLQTSTLDPDDFELWTGTIAGVPSRLLPRGVARQRRLASDVFRDFYRARGDDLVRLQQKLFLAGFDTRDPDEIPWGEHDEESFDAFRTAVARAGAFLEAGQNVSLDDILSRQSAIAANRAGGRGAGGRQPLTVELPDARDLAAGIDDAARGEIGKVLQQPDVQRYVADYNQLLTRYQQQTYNAQDAGGTVAAPPTLASFAQQRVEQERPSEAFQYDLLGAFDQLARMIGEVSTG